MKTLAGFSALLLSTSLMAGAAYADPHHHDGDNSQDQSDHSGPPPQGGPSGNGPPPGQPAPNFHYDFHHSNDNNRHVSGSKQDLRFHGNGQQQTERFSRGPTFRDRNVAHFSPQDRTTWTRGHWSHGRHGNRDGWWWNAGGAWFFYDQPIYPYPGYASDYYYEDDYGAAPDDQYAPGNDGGGYYWYYCNNPPGYYPYVQQCRGPWRPVEPTPPGAQQGYYDQGGPDMDAPDGSDDDQDGQGPPTQHNGFQGDRSSGPPPGYQDSNGPDDANDGDQGPPPQHY